MPLNEEKSRRMREAVNAFHALARESGCDGLSDFTGLLNLYVDLCERADYKGGGPPDVKDYEVAYLAEQFKKVFGESFRNNSQAWNIFTDLINETPVPSRIAAVG